MASGNSQDAIDVDVSQLELETVAEGPVSIVSRSKIPDNDGKALVIAVKSSTIHLEYAREPHDIVKELRIVSSLLHANVVSILGFKIDRRAETLKFWMPFVQYRLSDLLASLSFTPQPLASLTSTSGSTPTSKEQRFVVLAKSIIFQVINAIAYLHHPSRKIAHRDIKPNNILLTETGCVKLIDFGIAWREGEGESEDCKEHDLWPEYLDKMYFEVSTGPYRAPELVFGPRTYDAFAIDLWSLGATLAEFFTPLRLSTAHIDFEDDDLAGAKDYISASNGATATREPFIVPPDVRVGDPSARWSRDPLFDARAGEIGLAWSIFRVRGTPNESSWPTFLDLPDAPKVSFVDAHPVHLHILLPHLPPSQQNDNVETATHNPPKAVSPTPLDLIHRFLIYPQDKRLRPAAALRHMWFAAQPPFLLPLDYPRSEVDDGYHVVDTTWEGEGLAHWLRINIPSQ